MGELYTDLRKKEPFFPSYEVLSTPKNTHKQSKILGLHHQSASVHRNKEQSKEFSELYVSPYGAYTIVFISISEKLKIA